MMLAAIASPVASTEVSDEQAAMFQSVMTGETVMDLEGVTVVYGVHPMVGFAIIVSPALGKHLILSNPFDRARVFC